MAAGAVPYGRPSPRRTAGTYVWAYLCLLIALPISAPVSAAEPHPDIELFVREGCPHCVAAKAFLADLQHERPSLRVTVRDVGLDPGARQRLTTLAIQQRISALGVPAWYVRGNLVVGFRSAATTGARLRALLDLPQAPQAPEAIVVPFVGALRPGDLGLPLFTLAIGLLDGFNPCAMWVLLFLLSLLVNLHDRTTMALLAGVFVLVSGAVYFLLMAAWLNVFLLIGVSRVTQMVLGSLASLVGAMNITDFARRAPGVSLVIPDSTKPGLYARMRRILYAENLRGAMLGIAALAVLVNAVELLCTAGFPFLYTQILTLRQLPLWEYYAYLGLYNLAYIFDDALIVTIAVVTLGHHKLQERGGRWLKLLSGIVMLALGLLLILVPESLVW